MPKILPQSPPGRDLPPELRISGGMGRKRWLLRLGVWSLVIILTASAFALWKTRDKGGTTRYKTTQAHKGNITVTVSATGNLQPTNEVEVGSELSGIVKSVEVDYNDQVQVGQILARLDTSKLAAQILQSQAALDSARAKVLQTEATIKETRAALDRLREVGKLTNNKAVSKSDLDSALAALDRAVADNAGAKASVSQAEATLQLNRTDLNKTEIRSPINGIVLARSVEPGQTVAASLQAPVLFTLAEDLTKMELHVDVDEADVGRVRAGQQASFTVDAYPDRSYPAEITQIRYGATTTSGVVTYETILKVDNSDLSLRPGMTATAEITVAKVIDALLVANAALRYTPEVQAKTGQSGGSLLSKLMPRRPRRFPEKQKEVTDTAGRKQHIWALIDNRPVSVAVTTGLTDGTSTQIVAGEITPGTDLIVYAEIVSK
jgi:HlyD family secretion protein